MLRSIVVCIDESYFYTGHPIWTGPYAVDTKKLKVGDKIYYSTTTYEWVKDNEIVCR